MGPPWVAALTIGAVILAALGAASALQRRRFWLQRVLGAFGGVTVGRQPYPVPVDAATEQVGPADERTELDRLRADLEERERRAERTEARLRREQERIQRAASELRDRERALAARAAGNGHGDHSAATVRRRGPWSIDSLERLIATSDAPAAQIEEARFTLTYLRAYADVEGRLPASFDNLVATFFEPLSA